MKSYLRFLSVTILSLLFAVSGAFCANLIGSVSVNQTSDTATNAKNDAMNLARRQILFDVLSQYTVKDYLEEALQKSSDEELMNLVESTSVSNEQISSDSYSAIITVNLDNNAVKTWLNNQGLQNWIPNQYSDEKFTAFIVVQNGIFDWAEIKRIARNDNIDIEMQSMTGNQIFARIPLNYQAKFVNHINNSGWKYTDNGGILQIWK